MDVSIASEVIKSLDGQTNRTDEGNDLVSLGRLTELDGCEREPCPFGTWKKRQQRTASFGTDGNNRQELATIHFNSFCTLLLSLCLVSFLCV